MANTMKFKELLLTYRGRWGWTQDELAKRIGVHRNTIASWENRVIPSREAVLQLAHEFQLSDEERKVLLEAAGFQIEKWQSFLTLEMGNQVEDVSILNHQAEVYRGIGQIERALSVYEQALLICREVGDRGGEAITLNNLAVFYQDIGQPERALNLFEQALFIHHEMNNRTGEAKVLHRLTTFYREVGNRDGEAATLANLAGVYQGLGQFLRASTLFEQALSTMRKGGNRVVEATTLNGLGEAYRSLGQPQRALALLNQALPLHRETVNRVGEATTLSSLGEVYRSLGQPQQALNILEQALFLHREVSNRAGEATTLNNLALVYQSLRQPQRALGLLEQALFLHREVSNRAGEAITLNNLALVYQSLRQPQRALRLFEQALFLHREVNNRVGEATALNNPGEIYRRLEQQMRAPDLYEQAMRLDSALNSAWAARGNVLYDLKRYEEALAAYEQALLLDPLDARTWTNKGDLLHNLGQDVEALVAFDKALFLDPTLVDAWTNKVNVLKHFKRNEEALIVYEQAERLLRHILHICEQQLGALHPDTATSLDNLALLYKTQGKYEQAEPLYRRALAIRELQLGPIHLDTVASLNNLATLYRDQGKYTQAKEIYQRALQTQEQQPGSAHLDVVQLLNNLALLYQSEGNFTLEESRHQHSGDQSEATALPHGRNMQDFSTQQRYVNACLVRQANQSIVPKTMNLGARSTYDLRLNIDSLFDESVVQNAEQYPFPVSRLPQTGLGYWLEVVVVSNDFAVPLRCYPLFLPHLGPSWVCNCLPGEEHHCDVSEHQPYLFISLQTPDQPGIARLRIALYYQRNLLQSQLLTAQIAEAEQVGAGYSSIIDYTLTSDLHELRALPPRTLHILTNDNSDGSHRIIVKGEGDDILAFNLTEGQIRVTVDAAREALRTIHFEEYGGALGSQRQRRNLLDGNNAKTREAFIQDLARLAPLGWKLWTLLFKDRLEWRKKLLSPATIQVSRTISSTLAFPWALVYDIPLDSQGKYNICPLIENWHENRELFELSASRCPHEHTHGLKNTLCPSGFWGFRHVIEQPPSMPEGRNLPLVIHLTNQPPALIAGLSQALEKEQTEKHLQAMQKQLTLFSIQDHTSLQNMIAALASSVEIVYFYCHRGREPLVGTSQYTPYLQIGTDERFQPSDITTWRVADWPEHHWEQTSPLVFINGCHTAELTPELLFNFVDAFSTAYASGVIGTEIAVEQHIAAEAAELFFNAFQTNKTVGEALRQMRLHLLAKGNMLGLVYTPYCSASLRL